VPSALTAGDLGVHGGDLSVHVAVASAEVAEGMEAVCAYSVAFEMTMTRRGVAWMNTARILQRRTSNFLERWRTRSWRRLYGRPLARTSKVQFSVRLAEYWESHLLVGHGITWLTSPGFFS
jgi:hypothetical protein